MRLLRRRAKSHDSSSSSLESSFLVRQTLGKALKRVNEKIPKSPGKKELLTKIVATLFPQSKKEIFSSARKKESPFNGRPPISTAKRDIILSILERPDISYCMPGQCDTVYCGKIDGDKIFKSKHLLWTYREIKELFDKEHDFDVSYYYLQKIIKDEKHILPAKDAKDDDCRCEKCENLELLLVSIKASLLQAGKENLASRITVDPIDYETNRL